MSKIEKLKSVQNIVMEWYRQHGRDFPWRHTKDPYRIMIAEFMLHRTRADQVVPVYLEFIKKYPDVYSLAGASEEKIKKVTEHLGLHWRSRHFTGAAKYVVENYGGCFPPDRKKLLAIPGVGDYVAGAIITVCFDRPAPVVDSNIARFINRFYRYNLKGEIRRKKEIVEKAGELFQCDAPGKLLFALVDFTSLICKPQTPRCDMCFLKDCCRFYRKD